MPNIRKQILGPLDELGGAFAGKVGLHITASDGRSVTITREEILAHTQSLAGARAVTRPLTAAWLGREVEAALGREQVAAGLIALDFDDADGSPSRLELA